MPQETLDSFDTPSFNPKDAVIDRDQLHDDDKDDDPLEAMIVLDPNVGVARDVVIDDDGTTVADVNGAYPESDRVVRTIFSKSLTHNVTTWTQYPSDTFEADINQYCSEWNIPLNTYAYPESRLLQATDVDHPVEIVRPSDD